MNIINTAWMYADNNDPNGEAHATVTVVVDDSPPGRSVMASISLSYFSEGVSLDQNAVGAAGALVRSWDVFDSDGTQHNVENTDYAGNAEWIDNCALVTFELDVTYGRAYAQATVFGL